MRTPKRDWPFVYLRAPGWLTLDPDPVARFDPHYTAETVLGDVRTSQRWLYDWPPTPRLAIWWESVLGGPFWGWPW